MNRSKKKTNDVFANAGAVVEKAHSSNARGAGKNAGKKRGSTLDKFAADHVLLDESQQQQIESLEQEKAELQQLIDDIRDGALVVYTDGAKQYGRFEITETSIKFPKDTTEDEWKNIGYALLSMQQSINWYLGDWMRCAEDQGELWTGAYVELSKTFGYEISSLQTFASICRKIESLTRVKELSFAHHRLVTKLDTAGQEAWLERAVAEEWSVKQMREAMRGTPQIEDETDKQHRNIMNRVWRKIAAGQKIKRTDYDALERWMKEIKKHVE